MNLSLAELLSIAEQYEKELPPMPEHGQVDLSLPVAQWIDHTILKPDATIEQIEQLCQEAAEFHFASVCINPIFVPRSAKLLQGSGVKTCTVIGFPLGATSSKTKAFETRLAVEQGAQETDMVIPIGLLKSGEYAAVLDDISAVVEAAHAGNAIVKVILEMVLLSQREKIIGCLLSQAAGAEFVKTSTGFSTGGATVADIQLMRRVVGPISKTGVKAAGGIRSLADAKSMLEAGANRLGSSAGVKITKESIN